MGEVEKYGTGLIRIRNWINDYRGLEFTLEEKAGSMLAVLAFNNQLENKDTLNDRQKGILNFIEENSKTTQHDLAGILSVSIETIKRDIEFLQKGNWVKRIGSKKTGRWKILDKE